MGEAKRRRQLIVQGQQDPGPHAPTPTSPRWGERKQLEATQVAELLEQGKPIPPPLHRTARRLLKAAEKLAKKHRKLEEA